MRRYYYDDDDDGRAPGNVNDSSSCNECVTKRKRKKNHLNQARDRVLRARAHVIPTPPQPLVRGHRRLSAGPYARLCAAAATTTTTLNDICPDDLNKIFKLMTRAHWRS